MNHGSLFTGIGGFDLAAERMGWENIFQVEIDRFCTKVLEKNFPRVRRYGDIKEFDGTEYRGLIDILTGGFPCQPFSLAGKQEGKGDDRYLWPEMLRVIREILPAWVVGENVPGIVRMALEDICLTLESEGYEVQPFIIPSAGIGAWDKRDRVWIIAYNSSLRGGKLSVQQWRQNKTSNINPDRQIKVNPDTDTQRLHGDICRQFKSIPGQVETFEGSKYSRRISTNKQWEKSWIEVASKLCRSNARVPHRMDRIKALGNSVNSYVVYQIFKAIEQYEITQAKKQRIRRAEPYTPVQQPTAAHGYRGFDRRENQ